MGGLTLQKLVDEVLVRSVYLQIGKLSRRVMAEKSPLDIGLKAAKAEVSKRWYAATCTPLQSKPGLAKQCLYR